jgi:tetratricopeptide (TPR) repeat protein
MSRFAWIVVLLFSVSTGYASSWQAKVAEASRLCADNRMAEAAAAYATALKQAADLGSDDTARGMVLFYLGDCYHGAGKLAEARRNYLRSMTLLERTLGIESATVLRLATSLATLYIEAGQVSRAERLIKRFLAQEGLAHDPDRAGLLDVLGSTLLYRGKYAEAERVFQQAIAVLEGEPAYREQAVVALNNLTFLYSKARRMPEALAYSDRTRALLGTIPNPSPAVLAKTLTNAALLSAYEKNTSEAESLFEKAIAISEKDLEPEHPVLGEVLTAYAGFLRQTKQKAKAKEARRRGEAILAAYRRGNALGHTVEAGALLDTRR